MQLVFRQLNISYRNKRSTTTKGTEMDAYWFYDEDADEYVRIPAAEELN